MRKNGNIIKSFIDYYGKSIGKWACYSYWCFEYYGNIKFTREEIPNFGDIENEIKVDAINTFRGDAHEAGFLAFEEIDTNKSVLDYTTSLFFDRYNELIDVTLDLNDFDHPHSFLHCSIDLMALSLLYENFDEVGKKLNLNDDLLLLNLSKLSLTLLENLFLLEGFWIPKEQILKRLRKAAKAPRKDKTGFYNAIKEIISQKGKQFSREQMWRYLQKNHNREENAMEFDLYQIWIQDNRMYQKKYHLEDADKTTLRSIPKATFFKYVTEVRPIRSK